MNTDYTDGDNGNGWVYYDNTAGIKPFNNWDDIIQDKNQNIYYDNNSNNWSFTVSDSTTQEKLRLLQEFCVNIYKMFDKMMIKEAHKPVREMERIIKELKKLDEPVWVDASKFNNIKVDLDNLPEELFEI